VNNSIEDVREEIQGLMNHKWYELSPNITGKMRSDGSYQFTQKWMLGYIRGIESDPAYLNVKVLKEKEFTVINVKLRPNAGLVFFFYLIVALFVLELVGMQTMLEGPKVYKLLILPFFAVIIFGMMKWFTVGLKKRFERNVIDHLNLFNA
jgi:hypothetical protein